MRTLEEIRNAQAKCSTSIAKELVENLRYDMRQLTTKNNGSISVEDMEGWNVRMNTLHHEAYKVYYDCYKNGLSIDNKSVNLKPVYDELHKLLEMIGEVSEHPMFATTAAAIIIVGASPKDYTEKSDELKTAISNKTEANKALKNATAENFDELFARAEATASIVKSLSNAPDQKNSGETKGNPDKFAKKVEKYLAEEIYGQSIKSPAQIAAEREAKKAERKAKNKAHKIAKRLAEKAAKAAAEAEAKANA